MRGWTSMVDTRKRRVAVFLFFLLAFGVMLVFFGETGKPSCMAVPVLTEEEQADLGEYVQRDLSRELQYNSQRAAVDCRTSTIYIAQDIRKDTKMEDLTGSLGSFTPSLRLSFAPDPAFHDLAAAVEQGHVFKLNVSHGYKKYMQYDMVFTTLPVLRLEGEGIGETEKGKEIVAGTMCLWTPWDPDVNSRSVKTSNAQWHIRGGYSATLQKTPFKLNLKNKTGTGKSISLAGLGADDDWILNPMNLDDTKLKEKLFMQLWNRRARQVDWNEKMSEGEYVEVIINQEYCGLYQLQRRIDRKFLNLKSGDVLLKSGADLEAPDAETAYEIIHSGLTREQTYALVQDFFDEKDPELLNMDNFLDVNLFLQWASAVDNMIKNMFFVMKEGTSGYQMSLLPWDTDMSWGTVWKAEINGFGYDFEMSRQNTALRIEYEWMQKYYPDLDQQMAGRWKELRETLLTMENISGVLEQEQQILDSSGVLQRDAVRWGLYYKGEDSKENLYRSIEARLAWVDEYYSQYLQ